MKPRVLKIRSGALTQNKQLIEPVFCRVGRNFSGARMIFLNPTGGAASPLRGVTANVTNNLRAVNNISIRVTLQASNSAAVAQGRTCVSFGSVNSVAQTIIDDALRKEIDRELTLMERGENIGSNQRRLNRMRAYLNAKPYHVIHNFYGVHMHNPAGMDATPQAEERPFYTDIVREKSVQETHSVSEIHLRRETEPQTRPDAERNADAKNIAGQVLEQVEKHLRLEQERRGVWF